jgi:hypothetical protein
MYLSRDVRFSDFHTDNGIALAMENLNELTDFRGPKIMGGDAVTTDTIFRGPTEGDLKGPYVSQFLVLPIQQATFSSSHFSHEQMYKVPVEGNNANNTFMANRANAIEVISRGSAPPGSPRPVYQSRARYITTQRDLAWYGLHSHGYKLYYQASVAAMELPFAVLDTANNPYLNGAVASEDGNGYQRGGVTFGAMDIHGALGDVARRALKGAFYHKWRGHLRLRPEEFGLKLDNIRVTGVGVTAATNITINPLDIHPDMVDNEELLRRVEAANLAAGGEPSWLLGQAFPQGSPTHPAYPSGHATIAGACSTVMKAFFDENVLLYEPTGGEQNIAKVPSLDGADLHPYNGTETLTLGGEIDKLASNLAYARQSAGVHYRSDSEDGLELGESIAMEYLWDLLLDHPEPNATFQFTKRNGQVCRITHAGILVNGEVYVPPGGSQRSRLHSKSEGPPSTTSTSPAERCNDPDLGGIFAKTLTFDGFTGLPDEDARVQLAKVLCEAELDVHSLTNIPQGFPQMMGQVNPMASFAPESRVAKAAEYWASYLPPRAPLVDSAETAGEMVEVYWMFLTRDVKYAEFDVDPTVAAAVQNVNALSDFQGPRLPNTGQISSKTLFRGTTVGDLAGPYISQLLTLPNEVFEFGTAYFSRPQKYWVPQDGATKNNTFMTRRQDAVRVLSGLCPRDDATVPDNWCMEPTLQPYARHIISQRDLAWFVRYTPSYNVYLEAVASILHGTVRASNGGGNKFDRAYNPYFNGNIQNNGTQYVIYNKAYTYTCTIAQFYITHIKCVCWRCPLTHSFPPIRPRCLPLSFPLLQVLSSMPPPCYSKISPRANTPVRW